MSVAMLSMELFGMSVSNERRRMFEDLVSAASKGDRLDSSTYFVEQAMKLATYVLKENCYRKGDIWLYDNDDAFMCP
jgi:hypothetical protein